MIPVTELVLDGVTKRYGEFLAVDDIDLRVREGELLALVGPSGCGKTSVLRLLAGLSTPSDGEVYFDGDRVTNRPARTRDVGFVFQDYALFPHKSVRENLAFNLRMRGRYDDVTDRVARTAEMLQIERLLDRGIDELSGGQKQRVALGRAIASSPRTFLLDEPFANLDAELRDRMRTEVARLQSQLGTTTVHVTHDQAEALSMGDRVAVMRDGSLQQVGSPETVYIRPANRFVAGFIGTPPMNFLTGQYQSGNERIRIHLEQIETEVSVPIEPCHVDGEANLEVGIRPEDLRVETEEGGDFSATVEFVEFHGAMTVAHARSSAGFELIVTVNSDMSLTEEMTIDLAFDSESIHLFDPTTGTRVPMEERKTTQMVEPTEGDELP